MSSILNPPKDEMRFYLVTKRVVDTALIFCLGVLLLPICGVIALLVKATSPGPAFYSQLRVGRRGRLFRLHKFRSMVVDADKLGSSVTVGGDRRVTPVGRLLRKTKLDELPQLVNVLRGEMALVGPRPDVPEIVAVYTPDMRKILEIPPGITSNASLLLRDEEGLLALSRQPDKDYIAVVVPAKVAFAMEHVRRRSVLYDMSILVRTVWSLTLGRVVHIDMQEDDAARLRDLHDALALRRF
jgi:lipopolysaccharide/colanic/teichoic acid biosynthesis glycosyltransferase